MSQVTIDLPYTDTSLLPLTLDEAVLGEVVMPAHIEGEIDEGSKIEGALDAPLGKPRLEEMARPTHRVLILCDDNTRPTPAARILPHVLRRLDQAGVPDENIDILIASGTHRPMTDNEIIAKVGEDVANRLRICRHQYDDPSSLYRAGVSSLGVDVWLNKALRDADLVLGIGNVVPHPHVGWAGGAKILYPGVAGAETVSAFHLVGIEDPINYLGRDDAPARASLELLAETAGLDYVINTVLSTDNRIVDIFAGHPKQSQEAAREASKRVYCVPVKRRYDVVVSNSYPAYLEFWQAGKGIFSADLMLNPGGTIILIAPCPEGVGVTHPDQVEYLSIGMGELMRRIEGKEVHDPIAAGVCAKVCHIMQRTRVVVVTDGLDEATVRAMGFGYFSDISEALENVLSEYPANMPVAIITNGGETVPIMQS